jgi:hypothetical protein
MTFGESMVSVNTTTQSVFRIPFVFVVTLLCAVCFIESEKTFCAGIQDSTKNDLFVVGEELTYNVSYAFLDIGQVRIKILEKIEEKDQRVYKAIAYIDSYTGVPFVDLHAVYESVFDNTVFAKWFQARTKNNPQWTYVTYVFDYDKKKTFIEEGNVETKVVAKRDTIPLERKSQDGLSLFYFARKHVRTQQKINVPTVIQKQNVNTYIDFKNERTKETIDALDYSIDVIHFEGRADFEGIFGLTGEFEGWFSNDEARVPILAKMKVIIGDIRIELMKWKRQGWNPPKYVEQ